MNPFQTHGAISWQEYLAADVPSALKFYTQLLGLSTTEMPMPDGAYTLLHNNSKHLAGLMACPPDTPPCWVYYVTVQDIQRLLDDHELNLVVPVNDAMGVGTFAGFLDSQGAYLSVIQYHAPDQGDVKSITSFQDTSEIHGAFSWFELQTHDPIAAGDWYSHLFGWSISEMTTPLGTYFVISVDNVNIGGIMEPMDPNTAPNWSCIITVDDVDAVQVKASELGATILAPAFDLEGVGRILYILDSAGVPISFATWLPQSSEA